MRPTCGLLVFTLALVAQPSTGSLLQSNDSRGIRPLEPGMAAEREIAGGETHQYRIVMHAAQYLRVALDRQGLNLNMALFAPDGNRLVEVGKASHPHGPIPLLIVAESSGSYRLDVGLPPGDKGSERYRVGIEELRTATDEDRERVLAQRTFLEAYHLSEQGTAKSHRESIERHEKALSLYRSVGDRGGEARALNFIGLAYSELAENRKALDYYKQSLSLHQASGDIAGEASVLNNIGLAHSRLSEVATAIEYFNRAVPLRRASGDRQGEAITLNNLGMAHSRLSEYRKALDYLNQALPIYQAIGNRRLEAGALYNVAQMYASLGEWQKAHECSIRALPVARSIGNVRLEANILVAIGVTYFFSGEHQKALDYYTQALPLHHAAGNRVGEANTLIRIGRTNRLSGENRKALDQFDQALAVFRAVNDRRGEAIALRDVGQLYDFLGEKQKALALLNQALPVARAVGNRDTEAGVMNDIGVLYTSLGEYEEALDYLTQALVLYRSTGTPGNEVQALYNIARAHRGQGGLQTAQARVEEAIRIVESQRGKAGGPESRASYFSSVRKLYELDIDLLMDLSAREPSRRLDFRAIEASERARARSLLDLVTEARVDIRHGVDRSLIERERTLTELLNAKAEHQTRLLSGTHSADQAAALAKELGAVVTELQLLQSRIRAASSRYAALTQPTTLTLKEIQNQVLDDDTILLQYSLGEERSFVWVVSRHELTSHKLPKREEVEAAARRFYELIRGGAEAARVEDAAATLSDMLLSRVADRLTSKRIAVVADGILHYIPFAALTISKTRVPLIAAHEVVTLPSASVLAALRRELADRKPGPRAVAVFADPVFSGDDPRIRTAQEGMQSETGDDSLHDDLRRSMGDVDIGGGGPAFPRLPFSRREADAIAAAAPSGQTMKALDFHASHDRAIGDDLSDYRIIHFAAHGLLNSRHPELSGIVLSLVDRQGRPQNGFLRLNEVYNLKLRAELVVLSACQTGLGKEIRGEGLVGLTRGFMYAGSPRVVASLWKVDDAATAELMKRFYSGMFGKGLPPAAALRQAQIEMWNQERWRSPYYWAAFVLQGEWR